MLDKYENLWPVDDLVKSRLKYIKSTGGASSQNLT